MRPHKLLALSVLFALAACGGSASTPAPITGWVMDTRDGQTPKLMPAVEALAWRYDDYEGKQVTDIWISATPLTPEQRQQLLPARSGQSYEESTQPETMGLAGLLIRVDDTGNGSNQMLDYCLPADRGVKCSGGSGLGMALVRRFDAEGIAGEFYTRGEGGVLHAAAFDARLKDEASQPLPKDVSWSSDGGEAGKAWLTANQAAIDGNVATLKQHAMPERAADYDNPQTLKLVQRMALKQPGVLAGRQHGDQANLWVRDTVADKSIPGVIRIDLQKVENHWRVVGMRTN